MRNERPLPEVDSEAVDFRVPSESFAPGAMSVSEDLQPLRARTTHQGRTVPTVGGLLRIGRHREHFPDA